jgi:FAD/FMN-containing dehydrogenase
MATTRFASTGTDVPAIAIPQLRATVRGRVIAPEDPDYDAARAVPVGGIDRRPAAIVRVADARDVARVVTFAGERDLPLAVRSGGHSMAGHGVIDGGIVLDLGALTELEIDVAGRTAWAGTGLTAGAYTARTGELGLATGFGDTASVGIGGITLAGGIGYLVRQHGLTIDNLLAAEGVTADGEVRYTDAGTEPELFWALRGGGGNVGVATRLRFRLHEVDTITGGMLMLPATPETIAGFVAAAGAAPEALSTIATVMPAPPLPFVPAERRGERVILANVVHAGGGDAGERAVAPFRALAAPIVDLVGPKRYPEVFPPEGGPALTGTLRTMFVDRIDRDVAGTIVERLEASTAPMAVAQIRVLGGAMARVPVAATAFAHRTSKIMVNVAAVYGRAEDGPAHLPWLAGFAGALRQGDGGAYAGFLGDEGEARVRAAYPGATWERLAAIKARYDPDNLFRRNQNVPPAVPIDAEADEESDAA